VGRVCLLWPPLTTKKIHFDDQIGLNASECRFAPDLDLLSSFPHDLHHENDVSGQPQRACARTARKAISYPLSIIARGVIANATSSPATARNHPLWDSSSGIGMRGLCRMEIAGTFRVPVTSGAFRLIEI